MPRLAARPAAGDRGRPVDGHEQLGGGGRSAAVSDDRGGLPLRRDARRSSRWRRPTSGLMFTNDVMPVKVRWFLRRRPDGLPRACTRRTWRSPSGYEPARSPKPRRSYRGRIGGQMDGMRVVVPFHVHGTLAADAIFHYKMPCDATLVRVDTYGTANVTSALIVGTAADDNGYITTFAPGAQRDLGDEGSRGLRRGAERATRRSARTSRRTRCCC